MTIALILYDTNTTCDPAKEKCETNPPPPPTCDPAKDPSCKPPPPSPCPKDTKLVNGKCVSIPPPPPCLKGFHHDKDGKCIPDVTCPPGFHVNKGVCTKNIVINVIKKTTTEVHNTNFEITVKNFILYNLFTAPSQGRQSTFLILLDTGQLCQIAGDIQCVSKQNQFKTFNLITKLDSTGRSWMISGQVENVASGRGTQSNVHVIAHFYDVRGNNIGGLQQVAVTPGILKILQSGAFNIKASTSVMSGTPTFLRLEFQTSPP